MSNNDLRLHFGLGSAAAIDSIDVVWPSGLEERFTATVDGFVTLVEGSGKAVQH